MILIATKNFKQNCIVRHENTLWYSAMLAIIHRVKMVSMAPNKGHGPLPHLNRILATQ